MRKRVARTPIPAPLIVGAVLFGAVMAWLLIASLVPHQIPTYALRPAPSLPARILAPDTVTIDARGRDDWRFFAFGKGPLTPPDTSGWDLAFRRFHVIVAADVARLDTVTFDALRAVPTTGYMPTTFDRDTVNPALARWYQYSMFSHLLRPKHQIYVIRSRGGRYTKLEFLSYYCPGPEPGCVTIRYAPLPSETALVSVLGFSQRVGGQGLPNVGMDAPEIVTHAGCGEPVADGDVGPR